MARRATNLPRPEVLAFLADVKEHPDDDTPRLVLADWLEEHGDPRGEFVRLQCQRHRLPSSDPAQAQLEQREKELLAQHKEEWLGVLAESGIIALFTRGLVRARGPSRKLLSKRLASMFPLEATAWVSILRVTDMRADDATKLAESPHWKQLNSLNLDSGYYYADHLSTQGMTAGMGAHGGAIVASLPLLAHLVELSLARNDIGASAVATLAARTDLGQIRSLDLSGNNLRDEGAAALASCRCLTRLTRLHLHQNRIGAAGAAALAQWPGLAQVISLSLSSNYLGPAGAAALAASPYLGSVTELLLATESLNARILGPAGFGPHQIGPEGMAALAGAVSLRRLTRLDLTGHGIGPEGAAALAVSPLLDTLTDLDLSDNALGDDGIVALAPSPRVSKLAHLDLRYNGIGDRGALALAASPGLSGLEWLGYHANRQTSEVGIRALRDRFGDRLKVEPRSG